MVDILTTVAALSRQQLFFTFAVVATVATLALFVVTASHPAALAIPARRWRSSATRWLRRITRTRSSP